MITTNDDTEHFTPLTPEEIEERLRERTVDKMLGVDTEPDVKPDIRTMNHVWRYRKYKNRILNRGKQSERTSDIELYVSQQNPRFFVRYHHNPTDGEKGWEKCQIDFEIEDDDEEGELYLLVSPLKHRSSLKACAAFEDGRKAFDTTEVPANTRPLTSEEKAACVKSLLKRY